MAQRVLHEVTHRDKRSNTINLFYHAVEGILAMEKQERADYDLGYWDLVAGGFIPFELNNAKVWKID